MKLPFVYLMCTVLLFSESLRAQDEINPVAVLNNNVLFSNTEESAPEHFQIGIATIDVPHILKKHLNLADSGAMISEVMDDSPAQKAGLQADDVITKIKTDNISSKVNSAEHLLDLIRGSESGKYTLFVLSEGKERTVELNGEKKADNTKNNNSPADFNVFINNRFKQDDQWIDQLKSNLLKIKGLTEDQEMEIKRTVEETRKAMKREQAENPVQIPIMGSPMIFSLPPGSPQQGIPQWNPQQLLQGHQIPGNMQGSNSGSSSNGVTISINKSSVNGQMKTQITVKRKKENSDEWDTWNITEDQIGTLPKDLQQQVKQKINELNSLQQNLPGRNGQGFKNQQNSGGSSNGSGGGSSGGSSSSSSGGSSSSSGGGSSSGKGNSSGNGNSSGKGNSSGMGNSSSSTNGGNFNGLNIPGFQPSFQQFYPQSFPLGGDGSNLDQKLDKIMERLEKLEQRLPEKEVPQKKSSLKNNSNN